MSMESLMELAKKRLVDLNQKSVIPEEIVGVLNVSEDIAKLSQEINDRSWSCDIHQLLLPFFRPLFQSEPKIREKVVKELLLLGLSAEFVSDYFLNMGNQPYFVFALSHEEVKCDVKDNLHDKAEEIMLRELRCYLFC